MVDEWLTTRTRRQTDGKREGVMSNVIVVNAENPGSWPSDLKEGIGVGRVAVRLQQGGGACSGMTLR